MAAGFPIVLANGVSGGAFRDWLAPFDARVYRFAR
jgi:hypothetical protein